MCLYGAQQGSFALGLCIDYVIYVDMRTATTKNRDRKTSYELCRGAVPDVTKLHCFVTVPKSKRKKLAKQGLRFNRAEPGRFVGFQTLFSSTYAVALDGWQDGSTARLVHSIDVTFDDSDFTSTPGPDMPANDRQLEEAKSGVPDTPQCDDGPPIVDTNPLCQLPLPRVVIEPMPVAQPAQPE